jgi:hypothetical protein
MTFIGVLFGLYSKDTPILPFSFGENIAKHSNSTTQDYFQPVMPIEKNLKRKTEG